eukprot:5765831-Amphidinium_carterae.1
MCRLRPSAVWWFPAVELWLGALWWLMHAWVGRCSRTAQSSLGAGSWQCRSGCFALSKSAWGVFLCAWALPVAIACRLPWQ